MSWVLAWLLLSFGICAPVGFAMWVDARAARMRAKAFADSVVADRVYVPIDRALLRYLVEKRGFRVRGYKSGRLLLEKP